VTEQTRWVPRARALVLCYVLGALACAVSQVIVLRQHGPVVYSNLLFVLTFIFREWLRQFALIGGRATSTITETVSSALVGLLFPAALALFRSERRTVRVASLVLLGMLVLMTLWWGRLPNI
jgi:hypothetical protein